MAKTISDLVHSILEAISGYEVTDDSIFSPRYIIDKINDVNATLIREALERGMVPDQFYKRVCCINVECLGVSCEINGRTVNSDTIIYKSEMQGLMQTIGEKALRYLGPDDMSHPINRVGIDAFYLSDGRQWTADKPMFTIIGNDAFFKNLSPATKFLCAIGIFADPTKTCNWNDDTSIYPTPDPYKLELRVKQDILSTFGIRPDDINDSKAMPQGQQPNQPQQE